MHFDLSKTYGSQKKAINRKLLPAVKSAINPSLQVYDAELLKVIKQLHKSRREVWKLKQDNEKIAEHNKKQHVASRRDQVNFTLLYFVLIDTLINNTLLNLLFNRN